MMPTTEKMMNITTAITPVEKGGDERKTLSRFIHSRDMVQSDKEAA